MPDGVLPALPVGGVVGEGGHDPEVDIRQGHLLIRADIQQFVQVLYLLKFFTTLSLLPW